MRQVTLRLTETGYRRLQELAKGFGVSFQALYEASLLTYVETFETDPDPARQALVNEIWAHVRRIKDSPVWRNEPRTKRVVIRLSDEHYELFRAACARHGVTQNAAFAGVVTPWPADTPPDVASALVAMIPRVMEQARELDRERRRSRGLRPR